MTPEQFLAAKASEAVKAVYGAEVDPATLQVQVTRKEFEGDFTLVMFPLLRITRQSPTPRARRSATGWSPTARRSAPSIPSRASST